MLNRILLLILLLSVIKSYAQQKKVLTHADYDLWKKIEKTNISKNGKIVVATVSTSTGRGDGYLNIYDVKTRASIRFKNGYKPEISSDGLYVFFLRKPDYEITRKERKDNVKKEKRAKDDFFIFDVRNNQLLDSMMRVKSFKIPEHTSGWVVMENYKNELPEKDKSQTHTSKSKVAKNLSQQSNYGLVYNITTKSNDTIFQLKDFQLPKEGHQFIFSTTKGDKKADLGVYSYDVKKGTPTLLDSTHYTYKELSIDRFGKQLAFVAAKDSTKTDSLKYELFYVKNSKINRITDTLGHNLRKNHVLSAAQRPYFSKNSSRLFFYSRPKQHFQMDSTLLEDEIPDVDVWTYSDKLIQPEQKAKLKQLKEKAYQTLYNIENKEIVALHDDSMEYISFDEAHEQRYILGQTNSPYRIQRSWDYPYLQDYYIVDTYTGKQRLALENSYSKPIFSPDGNHALFYDYEAKEWWGLDLHKNIKTSLTKHLTVNFYDEENDRPMLPSPYGFGGFTENGKALIYDQYDIWSVGLTGDELPINITKSGRKNNTEYRSFRLDPEHRNAVTYYNGGILVKAYNKTNKSESLYALNPKNGKKQTLVETDDFLLSGIEISENGNTLVFKKQNFQTYPDLYVITKPGQKPYKITDANPQQSNFKWGSVELVSWKSYDGQALEGLLYKPADFDLNKKHPMIAYFYEKKSDTYNRYYSPQPSASTVNISYLVSNGYVVFVPDIAYTAGQPGQDAYNSIISGVEAMEAKGFIDSDNMALQGQSWGGYQIAYLVTVTNKFKAAMAGAPVSNMTSAYGGIRWKSGMSRAFQYEKTQSRIGKNLWEGLDLYLENSPLFGIPNIETPLLIMHNDADGAVPYYQSIEMFMGMRRLNKPVWLLVYNDESHNLSKLKNKQDLSIRMMQYFDHYLKAAPAPLWMTEGLPHIMKGKDLRYDLDKS